MEVVLNADDSAANFMSWILCTILKMTQNQTHRRGE